MPRPVKSRFVSSVPEVTYFKPAGIPLKDLKEIRLSVEELEAVRLHDIEKLEQEEAAERMNVSRPTFQRVLSSARAKIADALFNGKAIKIEGGNFIMALCRFHCRQGHEWEVPFKGCRAKNPDLCPECKEPAEECVPGVCCRHLKDGPERHLE